MDKGIIIFADDEIPERALFEIGCKEYFPKYNLEIYENGSQLEKRLGGDLSKVAMIVTDNKMPGKYGSKIIEEYGEKLKIGKIILILYCPGDKKTEGKAIEDGATACFDKTEITPGPLCEKLKIFLSNNKF